MLPQLSKALSDGFSADQILDYIIKKFPSHKKKIEKAISGGFNASQILSYLSKQTSGRESSEEPTTEFGKLRGQDIANQEDRNRKALAAGTLAAGSLAAPIAATALQRAIPSSLSSLVPSLTAQTIGSNLGQITPQNQPEISQPSQPPVNAPNVAQPAQAVQPEVISNPKEYLEKAGVLKDVDRMLKEKNTPEAIAGVIGMKNTSGKVRGAVDPELLKNIEEYAKQKPAEAVEQPQERKIEPSSIVASPHGVGEVKAIRNGKAIIEVDGKKHQVDEDELIESPLPEKDLADLYADLIGGIEHETGQEVSKNVEWAGYDPKVNELVYKPHGSDKVYVYDDISPEDAQQLTSLLTLRKTSGENYIGPWVKGTKSPIGAAMSKLIQKIQSERGGKGNEYRNRFDTIYDALEPAKLAAKKKHAEAKKKAKKPRIT